MLNHDFWRRTQSDHRVDRRSKLVLVFFIPTIRSFSSTFVFRFQRRHGSSSSSLSKVSRSLSFLTGHSEMNSFCCSSSSCSSPCSLAFSACRMATVLVAEASCCSIPARPSVRPWTSAWESEGERRKEESVKKEKKGRKREIEIVLERVQVNKEGVETESQHVKNL